MIGGRVAVLLLKATPRVKRYRWENPCAWNETLEFQGLLIAIDFM
jgi:hypothetical protein